MEEAIVNRVVTSGLITFDLAEYYHRGERIIYDLKDNLFMGMILKEKDFRDFLKGHDWTQYEGKNVAITCSEDAIIPIWAYMLLTLKLEPYANCVIFGSLDDLEKKLFDEVLEKVDFSDFLDKRVVVKGCGELPIPTNTYVEVTRKLQPYVKSMMFGEPCSTVPLYKKPRG
ncbi:MAG: hypothetical protein ACI9V1_002898 [Spirosomataceae bacterium]|jgi:hypothetical protein